MKHLHIFSSANSYFPLSFIPFVKQHGEGEHSFMVRHDAPHLHALPCTIAVDFDLHISGMAPLMHKFDQLWIHSLFNESLALTLAQHEALASRGTWVMWGGEAYNGSEAMFALRRMLTPLWRRVALFTSQEEPIFYQTFGRPKALARVFYPNPLPEACLRKTTRKPSLPPALLLGHSAWPTERQREGLELLHASSLSSARVFLPLSYGDACYAKELLEKPSPASLRCSPLLRPLPPERYGRFLGHMDAALMLQQRQCALSTIYALLYMGIPVYIESLAVRQYLHEEHGIVLHSPRALAHLDVEEALQPLPQVQQLQARRFFNIAHVASLWNALFREDN